ncbi:hypothetical protein [Yunchengibacter salinarum]|uniref:hypothetical protein n=1 Tax=Yunchengibacter salinarum TaxID=3133399 RepID=UPI0035B5E239
MVSRVLTTVSRRDSVKRAGLALALLAALPFVAGAAWAAVTAKDIQVAARSIAFMQNPPTGAVRAVVVFEAGNADSKAAAEVVAAQVADNPKAGKATLEPVVAAADSVAGAAVVFIPDGLSAAASDKAGAAAKAAGIPTIGFGETCVRAGHCVVGISTTPKVTILINKAAAASAGIGFSAAFLMMVQEV